jgi:hypothetical protein
LGVYNLGSYLPRIKLTPQSNDGVPLQNTLTDAYAHHYRKEQSQLLRRWASQGQKDGLEFHSHHQPSACPSFPTATDCTPLRSPLAARNSVSPAPAPVSPPTLPSLCVWVLLGGLGGHSHRAAFRSCLKPFSTPRPSNLPTQHVSSLHSFPGTWIPPRQLSPLHILPLSPRQASQ